MLQCVIYWPVDPSRQPHHPHRLTLAFLLLHAQFPGNAVGRVDVNLPPIISLNFISYSEKPYLIWEVFYIVFTHVLQAGRLLLNESDFYALQNNFLPYRNRE